MRSSFFSFSFFTLFLFVFHTLQGQEINITLGPDQIGVNQTWSITATVNNTPLKNYSGFPNIEGFNKRGASTQSQTRIVNGKVSSSQSVVMTYSPTRQGVFTLPPFNVNINGQTISSAGKAIHVGAPVQAQRRDPFQGFFQNDMGNDFFAAPKTEFIDIEEDAFLAVTNSKSEVYVGEGFTTTLSFLVSDKNRAPMQFHNPGEQLPIILKKLKPSNCWEENFNVEHIEGKSIRIDGKPYTQFKIYQATFYPLNTQPIRFPRVGLEMIKYKVAKNPSFFGQNRKEAFKTFYSKPKVVKVKKLPPHPLGESVSVGDYHLDEQLVSSSLQTGQSLTYNFNIYGEGNIAAIEKPIIPSSDHFDFYEPNIEQSIKKQDGHVVGTKSFSYYMIPTEPGEYFLGDYFTWVFFNSKTHRYDTLQSQKTITVTGKSQKNQVIENAQTGSFYDRIRYANNTLVSSGYDEWIKIGAPIFILLILGGGGFLMFRK